MHLLSNALFHLWDGRCERDIYGNIHEKFICLAIIEGAPDDVDKEDVRALTGLIEDRLDDATFDYWAEAHGVTDLPSIQAGRRAWVRDLIEEFSA